MDLLPEFDSTETQRTVVYSTRDHHLSLMDFLEGLIRLRKGEFRNALHSYDAGVARLSKTSSRDVEIVRRTVNDAHRLRVKEPGGPAAHLALWILYRWLGEGERALQHAERYRALGGDPAVLDEVQRTRSSVVEVVR